jgi:CubicO group peptidase (beta-lactamase class C family)
MNLMNTTSIYPLILAMTVPSLAAGMVPGSGSEVVAEGRVQAESESWQGTIDLPGQALAINLELTPSAAAVKSGTISIPAQNAKNLPLEKLSVEGSTIKCSIKGIGGDPTFTGTISADGNRVEGKFTQGGHSFDFHWTKAADPAVASKEVLSGFVEWADQARKDWRSPGLAIAIIKDGHVVLSQGLGVRDLDKPDVVTEHTLFAIGSSTKAFTTFVMGTLVDDGKLAWDTPVKTYMPAFKLMDAVATDHMTPRDLVTHRSGLPRHDALWYNSSLTRAEMVSRLAFLEPNKEFRQTWQYNNLMFLTAGYLTEQVTGKSWEQSVKDRIFTPLGMSESNFSVRESEKASDAAQPYEWRDEKMRKMPFRDISQIGPAGSINSNLHDMVRWAGTHINGGKWEGQSFIQASTLEEIHRPQMIMPAESEHAEVIHIGYAMGWFVHSYRGHLMVEHGGNIDGFTAAVTLLPKDGIAVVALANMNGSPLPQLATYHALDRMLGEKRTDWSAEALAKRPIAEKMEKEGKEKKSSIRKQGTSPSHAVSAYAGEYEHPGYGIISVVEESGKLSAMYNNISAPLEHWHYDVFMGGKNEKDPTLEDSQLLFRTNLAGDIDSLEVVLDASVKAIVFQKKAAAKLSDPAYLAKLAGDYELGPQVVTVSLKGSSLVVTVPGQPPYDLVPAGDEVFSLKGLTGFSLQFVVAGDKITAAKFIQPNGVFEAKRK